MTTPARQELIRQARRAALRARLIGDGFIEADVDAWLDWRASYAGPEQDSPVYWEAGYGWIRAQLGARHLPGDGKEPIEV
jgi:hypothetical protein